MEKLTLTGLIEGNRYRRGQFSRKVVYNGRASNAVLVAKQFIAEGRPYAYV